MDDAAAAACGRRSGETSGSPACRSATARGGPPAGPAPLRPSAAASCGASASHGASPASCGAPAASWTWTSSSSCCWKSCCSSSSSSAARTARAGAGWRGGGRRPTRSTAGAAPGPPVDPLPPGGGGGGGGGPSASAGDAAASIAPVASRMVRCLQSPHISYASVPLPPGRGGVGVPRQAYWCQRSAGTRLRADRGRAGTRARRCAAPARPDPRFRRPPEPCPRRGSSGIRPRSGWPGRSTS